MPPVLEIIPGCPCDIWGDVPSRKWGEHARPKKGNVTGEFSMGETWGV